MNSLRILGRRFHPFSAYSLRDASRGYKSYVDRRRSPFLELFSRNRNKISVKHQLRRRRHYSSQAEQKLSSTTSSSTDPNKSFSQRLKGLTRKYGWAAVGTYFALSVLDYPFFFLAVRAAGTERIGQYEHSLAEWIKRTIPFEIPKIKWPWQRQGEEDERRKEGSENRHDQEPGNAKENSAEASKLENWALVFSSLILLLAGLWTQAFLAYALHKTFIFLRVPLTVAVTPKVVKTLRGYGWNIGNHAPKSKAIATQSGK